MWTLYRILIRMAVAWVAVAGVVILICCAVFHSSTLESVEALGLVAFASALLGCVLAWIVKPVQWTQDQ